MKRVLIIGSGGIGRRHLRGYTATGRAGLSIVEPHAERRAEAGTMFSLAGSYADWLDLTRQALNGLTPEEEAAIRGGNALRFYGLQV